MMDLKTIGMKRTEYSCETGQTDCTENLGHRGCGDIFYWALQNLSLLADAAGWLLNILWPLLLGFCMAFVLNIPMRFLNGTF